MLWYAIVLVFAIVVVENGVSFYGKWSKVQSLCLTVGQGLMFVLSSFSKLALVMLYWVYWYNNSYVMCYIPGLGLSLTLALPIVYLFSWTVNSFCQQQAVQNASLVLMVLSIFLFGCLCIVLLGYFVFTAQFIYKTWASEKVEDYSLGYLHVDTSLSANAKLLGSELEEGKQALKRALGLMGFASVFGTVVDVIFCFQESMSYVPPEYLE